MHLPAFLTRGLLAVALLSFLSASPARSATWTVTSLADTVVPSAGNCGANLCPTLREALLASSANDTIVFSADGTLSLSGGMLSVTKNLTIDGSGHSVTIDGNHAVTVVSVNAGVFATFIGLDLRNGQGGVADLMPGNIQNDGHLELDHCRVGGGNTTFGGGGGINNHGTLRLLSSTLDDNHSNTSRGKGGGVQNQFGGSVTLIDSVASNNSSGNFGGGFYSEETGSIQLIRSALIGNSAASIGGGASNFGGHFESVNSTLTGNSSPNGGAIYNSGDVLLVFSTLAGNVGGVAGDDDVQNRPGGSVLLASSLVTGCLNLGAVNDQGGNLDSGTSCLGNAPLNATSRSSTALNLAPLANYGGPTPTMPPRSDSAALDTGNDANCAAVPTVGIDQRGVRRPQGAHCDAGAVELSDAMFGDSFEALPAR